MDLKQTVRAMADSTEEAFFLYHILERLQSAQSRSIPACSSFMSQEQQAKLRRLLPAAGLPEIRFWGGTEEAERCAACFLPDYLDPEEYLTGEDAPIRALRVSFPKGAKYSHRDVLGSILALGIKREVMGDIFTSERSCDVLLTAEMLPFIHDQLATVSRYAVDSAEVPLKELLIPPKAFTDIRCTVASLRADALMAAGLKLSRSQAQSLISAGAAAVNHSLISKPTAELEEGDILTVKGYGRLTLQEISGRTRKDRISVVLRRYI